MIVQIADRYINLSHVREVTFDGEYTRLFFSGMVHDALKLAGDYRQALVEASGGCSVVAKAARKK